MILLSIFISSTYKDVEVREGTLQWGSIVAMSLVTSVQRESRQAQVVMTAKAINSPSAMD